MHTSYEEACAQHSWNVPEHYNIAADVCDKHPPDKLAMIHEHFGGAVREVRWGEIQAASNRYARTLREHGVQKGDRVAMLLPPTPETAAAFFATWKCGAILLSMSVLYGDDGIRHRVSDSGAKVLLTDGANAARVDPSLVEHVLLLEDLPAGGDESFTPRGHARRRPGPALLLLRHDRPGQGDPARAPLPARARGVHLLPRRAGRRAVPRHGRVGVGGGDRATARTVAPRGGAARLPARGRLRARAPARRALAPRRYERLHDADGDALDDGHRRRGQALPAAVPHRLQRRRAAQPGGDPLVPRAVPANGARLLRPHGVLSARRQLPVPGRARGLDGQADAGLGRAASSTRTSARSRSASAARSACARARTRTIRSATGTTRRPARRRSAASGSTRRTPRGSTRTATSGTRAAPTT